MINLNDIFFNIITIHVIPSLSLPGLELLTVFKKQLDDYLEQRQELKSAEKLFDMPITVFQDLLHIQKDMKGLEQLYSIYKEQKVIQ